MRRRSSLACAFLAALLALEARAQPDAPAPQPPAGPAPPWRLVLDPGATRVDFELGATLHRVRGSFEVRRGELRFDPAGGAVAGRVVVDAASGRTGNARRDRNMHADVLESARHPEIALAPERLEVTSRSGDGLRGVLHGRIEICGGSHAVAIPVEARRIGPERARVGGRFEAPYVEWGLEDPSTFLLGVDPVVSVRFTAEGRLTGP